MTDNGAHSFTESAEVPKEGSEPIQLTDEQLLEVKIWNVFRDNQYSSRIQDHIDPVKKIVYEYAAEQLKEERNKAIQWCINSVNNISDKETLLKKLESLKSDSK